MNSFLYGMELFQIRMNTFQIGMYSLYVRYSHTDHGNSSSKHKGKMYKFN